MHFSIVACSYFNDRCDMPRSNAMFDGQARCCDSRMAKFSHLHMIMALFKKDEMFGIVIQAHSCVMLL
jgi:hypothetical protein